MVATARVPREWIEGIIGGVPADFFSSIGTMLLPADLPEAPEPAAGKQQSSHASHKSQGSACFALEARWLWDDADGVCCPRSV